MYAEWNCFLNKVFYEMKDTLECGGFDAALPCTASRDAYFAEVIISANQSGAVAPAGLVTALQEELNLDLPWNNRLNCMSTGFNYWWPDEARSFFMLEVDGQGVIRR